MVDRDGLENRCTLTGTQGSNPCLSAKNGSRKTSFYILTGMRTPSPHIVRSTGKRSDHNNRVVECSETSGEGKRQPLWTESSRPSYFLFPLVALSGFISPRGAPHWDIKKKTPKYLLLRRLHLIEGGYLLSHFRTTIGVTGFNFSVRNGKRWSPRAITTLVSSVKERYTLMPSAFVGFPRRIRLEKEFLEASLAGSTANL